MSNKVILYTPAALNGGWLLISIDAALWLHKSKGIKEVKILTISDYNPFNIYNLILRLKNISSYFKKNKLKKLINFLKFFQTQDKIISDISSFATGKSDEANLKIGDLEIQFQRKKFTKKKSLFEFINIHYRVLSDYLNYFSHHALRNKLYLDYKVSSIYSGFYVMSEALRVDYKSFGSIFNSKLGILSTLYKLHELILKYKEIEIPKKSLSFVCGPAQLYIYGFFTRYMLDRGSNFIDTCSTQLPFINRAIKEKHYSNIKIFKIKKKNQILVKKKIFDYYKNRIRRPWEAFDYMNFIKKKNPPIKNKISFDGPTVIIYLHSFTDAQYMFGYDGYHDLMDWSLRTISLLNSNKHVSKVIVKPHPGIDETHHPGDKLANTYLRSKISAFTKVQWVDFHFDVNQIVGTSLVVGITHHGSIAEELVFNKIPVVTSAYAPWGKKYKFGYVWDNLENYETLISGNSITKLEVTKTQTDELYRYAMDKYFAINPKVRFDDSSAWQDMLEIHGIKNTGEHDKSMEQINRLISKIDTDSSYFKKYINIRLNRIDLLLDFCNNIKI